MVFDFFKHKKEDEGIPVVEKIKLDKYNKKDHYA
jgi:hypothetical protein